MEIHGVDWRAAGLEGFGKPEGLPGASAAALPRAVEPQHDARDPGGRDRPATWPAANSASPAATIVHGDYRLGNVLLAPESPATIAAVLDWEMSTIGDPLADLGYFCTLYVERDDPPLGMFELSGATREEGWPTRAELVARYEEKSGRSMTDIRWYQTLALWKSIVFMEGTSAARHRG